jgi:hypothetical protein
MGFRKVKTVRGIFYPLKSKMPGNGEIRGNGRM